MYGLEELNDVQKSAVLDTEGAVLVTAGAGSGKTRLLTHRIAHLINDLNVKPYNILAITFTNKAANEMRTRLESMLNADGIWIFTFHAACVRILRGYIDKLGYNKNFTIYGDTETKAIVKRICKNHNYPEDMVKRILNAISDAKNNGIKPDEYESFNKFSHDAEEIAVAYAEYQNALKNDNALDYDDLLILTLDLLKSCQEAREFYQEKFRYIHIDEFQDTNKIQYDIVKILSLKHKNIFAVGDEDQCIYTWRGASVANIFDFQKDFACRVYKLEQNYRSTGNILKVANRIIKGNTNRLDKKLWTNSDDGKKVVCYAAQTDGFEADFVTKKIVDLVNSGEYNYSDCAVLLRLNALTRHFEERFLQYGISHRVYGGFKFYDRKEIKDVLAYARVAVNSNDDEAIYRIINFPKRHIGEASIEKIREYTEKNGVSAFDVVVADNLPFNTALNEKLRVFGQTLKELRTRAFGDVLDFFRYLLNDVLRVNDLFADDSDGEARLENLNELVSSVKEFTKNNQGGMLSDYLQMVSLYSDTDDMVDDNCVTIATVHSAKGLEYPVVFVVGLEDGIFPSLRQNESDEEHVEEERRLMYVAVTRAREQLYLSYARSRYLYGETQYNMPSRFLIEGGLVQRSEQAKSSDYGDNYDRRNGYAMGGSGGYSSRYGSNANYGTQRLERGNSGNEYVSSFSGEKFNGSYKSNYAKTVENKPQEQNSAVLNEIQVGVTVKHRRLGKGKVIGLETLGNNVYAKIDFEKGGVMQLAIGFAPLTVVEE